MEINNNPLRFRRLLAIAAVSFLIYNVNLIPMQCGDAIPAALLPFSVISRHSLYLDDFYPYYARTQQDSQQVYFFHKYNNHYLSDYPVALPLVITPFYIPVVYALALQNAPPEKIVPIAYAMGKLFASLIAALSVAAFYALLVTLSGGGYPAGLLTAAYAFGTPLWPHASQLLWQHGFGCLMLFLAFLFSLRSNGRLRFLVFAGCAAALAVAERYNNIFAAALIALFVVVRFRTTPTALIAFFSGPLTVAALLFWYNLTFFNNLTGRYAVGLTSSAGHLFTALAGLCCAPSRGMFIYSPFLLFSIVGIVKCFLDRSCRGNLLYAGFLAVIVLNLLLLAMSSPASNANWWGGWSYGPRQCTEIIPFLILFILPGRDIFSRFSIVRGALTICVGLSILIGGIGVFCYPKGDWNALPVPVEKAPWRLWDVRNNQILVEAKAGLNLKYADILYRKIKGKANMTPAEAALPDSGMRAEVRITGVPPAMTAGYSYRAVFSIVNRSGVLWHALPRKDGSFGISLYGYWQQGDGPEWKELYRLLRWDCAPGESWSDDCLLAAPDTPGTYTLRFDCFQTGVGRFSEKVGRPVPEFTIVVSPPAHR